MSKPDTIEADAKAALARLADEDRALRLQIGDTEAKLKALRRRLSANATERVAWEARLPIASHAAHMVEMSTIVAGPDRGRICRRLLTELIGRLPEGERDARRAECEALMLERGLLFWEGGNVEV